MGLISEVYCTLFRDLNNYIVWSLVNKLDLSVLPDKLAKARADFEKVCPQLVNFKIDPDDKKFILLTSGGDRDSGIAAKNIRLPQRHHHSHAVLYRPDVYHEVF